MSLAGGLLASRSGECAFSLEEFERVMWGLQCWPVLNDELHRSFRPSHVIHVFCYVHLSVYLEKSVCLSVSRMQLLWVLCKQCKNCQIPNWRAQRHALVYRAMLSSGVNETQKQTTFVHSSTTIITKTMHIKCVFPICSIPLLFICSLWNEKNNISDELGKIAAAAYFEKSVSEGL